MFGMSGRDACPREVEKGLEDLYTSMWQQSQGMSESESRRTVHQAIRGMAELGRREGTSQLHGEFGNFILLDAKACKSPAREIVDRASRDGATDADIREWWSLYDLQRRMVLFSEETLRYATYLSLLDQGPSADAAMAQVRKLFPMYGDPDDTQHVTGDDRPLPNEIRGRIDQYRQTYGAASYAPPSEEFSTFNAFVRAEIRAGRL